MTDGEELCFSLSDGRLWFEGEISSHYELSLGVGADDGYVPFNLWTPDPPGEPRRNSSRFLRFLCLSPLGLLLLRLL